MANTVFMSKTGLTGGEATKLDSIDGATLTDNDAAFVNVANVQYIYRLDADSGAAESSPNIIAPDTNPGDKRWILQGLNGASLNMPGLTASLPVFTDANKNLVSNTMTGTGKVVMDTSPTLVTPTIGAAAGTSLSLSDLTASLPVFSDGSKKLVSKSVADTLTALGVGAWTDYGASSTITGFSAVVTKNIYYKVIEKMVFIVFHITGTSNSTAFTFTLPYSSAFPSYIYSSGGFAADGGLNVDGSPIIMLPNSSATVSLYLPQLSPWINSDGKEATGQFFYPIA